MLIEMRRLQRLGLVNSSSTTRGRLVDVCGLPADSAGPELHRVQQFTKQQRERVRERESWRLELAKDD